MRKRTAIPILVAGLVGAQACLADEYELGQGVQAGDFRISGYSNIVLEMPHTRASTLDLDDTGVFIAGHVNRWFNPFMEAELTRLTLLRGGNGRANHGEFIKERLYNEMNLSDSDSLQIGQNLAPVGDWNLIHAAPLVPTETRPLTTSQGYSEYASGIFWRHDGVTATHAEWDFYAQPGSEWLPRPPNIARRQFRNVVGAHVNWSFDAADRIGLSFQRSELQSTGEDSALFGINLRRTFGRLMLESEAVATRWSGAVARAHDFEGGLYALADYAITPQWHAIAEAEHYQDHQLELPSKNTLLGFAYKPRSGVVWKVEFVDQTGVSRAIPTGWTTSFAVLF
jgi:hypothetical protein